jgi:hypothetical protein
MSLLFFDQRSSHARRLWWVIALLAITLRGAVLLSDIQLNGDAEKRYEPIARNLQFGNGFSRAAQAPYAQDDFDQPGYPYFVAAIYKLTSGNRRAVVVAQLILESLILVLVLKLGGALNISNRARMGAVAIGMVCPFLPIYSGKILTEVLATFILTLTCYLILQCAVKDGVRRWVFAGMGAAACLLVRPDTLASIILMTLALALISWRKYRLRLLGRILILLVSALAVLSPWMIRNYRLFHSPRPLGGVTAQVKLQYVKWLDTWLDDPKYLQKCWWNIFDPNSPVELPDKISEGDRRIVTSALIKLKEQGSLTDAIDQQFLPLIVEAKRTRQFNVFVLTPVRRIAMTWLRAPSYITGYWSKLTVYIFWVALLGCAFIGLIMVLRRMNVLFAIPVALLLGRTALPFISALASEPRYMFEALPICFILAGMALPELRTLVSKIFSAYRQEAAFKPA